MALGKRIKELEAELGRMWQRRKPRLQARLAGAGDDQAIRQAAGEVMALRAKEAALGEQLDQFKAQRLLELQVKHDRLVKQHGPQHAKVQEVREQIARLKGDVNEASADPRQAQAAALLKSIEQGLKSVEGMRAEVEQRFQHDLAESNKSEIGQLGESNLRNNLERQRVLFYSVVDQLKQAQFVSDFGSVTAQVLDPPAATENRPSVPLVLIAALVLGCGLGAGTVYVVDLVDSRVHSVPEIRRLMRLRVLGQIMQLPHEQQGAVAVGILCHAEPRSGLAESYKSIRTGIDLLRRNWNGQVLLVTSPQSGEGKSITASNLAISLAQSGRKVLLVDADLRHPSLHHIHGLHRRTGLTHVLADRLPLRRAVQPTPIENLELLAAGPDAPNPAELLATQRLVTFVEETAPGVRDRGHRLLTAPGRRRPVPHRGGVRRDRAGRPGVGHPAHRGRADPRAPRDRGDHRARSCDQRGQTREVAVQVQIPLRAHWRTRRRRPGRRRRAARARLRYGRAASPHGRPGRPRPGRWLR